MKTQIPRSECEALGEEIISALNPYCERIVLAGSIRRKREFCSDIEILYIPRMEDRQADMFTTEPFDMAHEELGRWLANGTLSKRPSSIGVSTWGQKNKLAIHNQTGIPVDFFATTAENWWVSLVVRTGGKESNLKLTTGAQAKGASLQAYGAGIVLQNKQVIAATGERHVFELCGVPYSEPEDRADRSRTCSKIRRK